MFNYGDFLTAKSGFCKMANSTLFDGSCDSCVLREYHSTF